MSFRLSVEKDHWIVGEDYWVVEKDYWVVNIRYLLKSVNLHISQALMASC